MNDEMKYSLEKFEKALASLKDGAGRAAGDLEKDGVIQRFEFTFELLWKTVRVVLGDKGVDVKAPKDTLKAAFNAGLIGNEPALLKMLEDRNLTSHIYDKETAETILGRIKTSHLPIMQEVLQKLKEKLK